MKVFVLLVVSIVAVTSFRFSLPQKVRSRSVLNAKNDAKNFFDQIFAVFGNNKDKMNTGTKEPTKEPTVTLPSNGVLVFGATGRAGTDIVDELLKAGRCVVVAAQNATKAKECFTEAYREEHKDKLYIKSDIDVTNANKLTKNLFTGVTQVVSSIGPIQTNPKMTAEEVDYKGNLNIIEALQKYAPPSEKATESSVVPFDKTRCRIS